MEKRFRVLRFIVTVYKTIAIILGVITLVGSIGFCAISLLGGSALNSLSSTYGLPAGPTPVLSGLLGGVIGGGSLLISGGLSALTLYALGEGIALFISLEENMRSLALQFQLRSG